jgi:cell division protein FtsB
LVAETSAQENLDRLYQQLDSIEENAANEKRINTLNANIDKTFEQINTLRSQSALVQKKIDAIFVQRKNKEEEIDAQR